MYIARVKVKAAKRIWPPPTSELAGASDSCVLTVINEGAGAVTILDAEAQLAAGGLSVASKGERTIPLGPGEQVFASAVAEEELVVLCSGGAGGS